MGKICAVPGCQSGRNTDRRNRTNLGLRQLTLFSIPKCLDKLSVWESTLGCTLSKKDFVCQLHFLDEHIKKNDKTILKNGVIHEIPRINWILTSDAVPVALSHPVMESQRNVHPTVESQKNVYPTMESQRNVHPTMESQKNTHPTMELQSNTHPVAAEEPTIDHTNMSGVNEIVAVKLNNRQIQRFDTIEITQVETQPDSPTEQKHNLNVFTIDDVKDRLSGMLLPEAWSWMQTSKGLLFTFHDRGTYGARIHLEMADDLSVTIITISGQRIPLDPVTSMTDICANFQIVGEVQVCSGTGVDNERRASNCFGILKDSEEYKRCRPNLRCRNCRNLRKTLQNHINRNVRTTKVSRGSPRRTVQLVGKKYTCRKKKVCQ